MTNHRGTNDPRETLLLPFLHGLAETLRYAQLSIPDSHQGFDDSDPSPNLDELNRSAHAFYFACADLIDEIDGYFNLLAELDTQDSVDATRCPF
jgi:hypothetical protein